MPAPRTDTDRLDRTMKSLTIGVVHDMEARKLQRELEGLTEREDQFVIEVAGEASEFPNWQEVEIGFGILFVNGTGHRDSPLVRPFFTYGAYIEKGGPIGLLACVTRWNVNDRDETTGCTIGIGAVATDLGRSFRGELHAVFQGYGAPADPYGDMEAFEGD